MKRLLSKILLKALKVIMSLQKQAEPEILHELVRAVPYLSTVKQPVLGMNAEMLNKLNMRQHACLPLEQCRLMPHDNPLFFVIYSGEKENYTLVDTESAIRTKLPRIRGIALFCFQMGKFFRRTLHLCVFMSV